MCRRLLNPHDAEDAFQATFLVLARKAASIRSRETAGNWLYGVAHQTALHARRTAARRRAKEVQVTTMPDTEAVEPGQWADLQPLLDEELSCLPDIYRTVIVLCDLEGRTRKEVAFRLGVPEGTVAGRISRARTLLARRLKVAFFQIFARTDLKSVKLSKFELQFSLSSDILFGSPFVILSTQRFSTRIKINPFQASDPRAHCPHPDIL